VSVDSVVAATEAAAGMKSFIALLPGAMEALSRTGAPEVEHG
jgi:hypothetical protein